MKNYLKKILKYILFILPWLVLVALGIYFGSQWLSNQIVNEFVVPFLK